MVVQPMSSRLVPAQTCLLGNPLLIKAVLLGLFIHDFELSLTLFDFDIGLVNEPGIGLIVVKSVHFII